MQVPMGNKNIRIRTGKKESNIIGAQKQNDKIVYYGATMLGRFPWEMRILDVYLEKGIK